MGPIVFYIHSGVQKAAKEGGFGKGYVGNYKILLKQVKDMEVILGF